MQRGYFSSIHRMLTVTSGSKSVAQAEYLVWFSIQVTDIDSFFHLLFLLVIILIRREMWENVAYGGLSIYIVNMLYAKLTGVRSGP